jgi:hypothetical protein
MQDSYRACECRVNRTQFFNDTSFRELRFQPIVGTPDDQYCENDFVIITENALVIVIHANCKLCNFHLTENTLPMEEGKGHA